MKSQIKHMFFWEVEGSASFLRDTEHPCVQPKIPLFLLVSSKHQCFQNYFMPKLLHAQQNRRLTSMWLLPALLATQLQQNSARLAEYLECLANTWQTPLKITKGCTPQSVNMLIFQGVHPTCLKVARGYSYREFLLQTGSSSQLPICFIAVQ